MKYAALLAFFLLGSCGSPPPTKDAEKVPEKSAGGESQSELKAEKKSIEEAANAAAKLVEEEAKAEIEALKQGQ